MKTLEILKEIEDDLRLYFKGPKRVWCERTLPETWNFIEDYPNYEISNYGNSRRSEDDTFYAKLLQPCLNTQGYLFVTLYNNNGRRSCPIHKLVAKVFLTPPVDPLLEINHKNYNRIDNYFLNLEFCSRKDNALHAYNNGRFNIVKYVVECPELNLYAVGLYRMHAKLKQLGYNTYVQNIHAVLVGTRPACLNLTFVKHDIEQFKPFFIK